MRYSLTRCCLQPKLISSLKPHAGSGTPAAQIDVVLLKRHCVGSHRLSGTRAAYFMSDVDVWLEPDTIDLAIAGLRDADCIIR